MKKSNESELDQKRQIMKITLLFMLISTLIAQDDFETFKREQEQAVKQLAREFADYKEEVTREYEDYVQQEQAAFEDFKSQIEQKWQEFKAPTKKTWVDYGADLNSRVEADFENGKVTVEVIVEEKDESTDVAEMISRQVKAAVEAPAGDGKPILDDQLPDVEGIQVKPTAATVVSKIIAKQVKPVTKSFKSKDGKKRKQYSVVLDMVPNHLQIRSNRFKPLIEKQSKRFNIDFAIAMAITETESAFNPKARSPVPAFGLMQLVSQTGARDAYRYVYKKDKLLKSDYLYVPENNIELGCAYIGLIRSKYFEGINDDKKSYLCVIAAYNTGIGNVAKTLTGTLQLNAASKKANSLSITELRRALIENLPYEETRVYLDKVLKRAEKYGS